MHGGVARLARLVVGSGICLLCAALTWLPFAKFLPLEPFALPALTGAAGAWLGAELGLRARMLARSPRLLQSSITVAIVGIASGAVAVLLGRSAPGLPGSTAAVWAGVLIPAATGAFASGWLGGRRSGPFAWVDGLLALVLLPLAGVALALGAGILGLFIYTPCPPRTYCLENGPWSALQSALPAGVLAGLWLGFIVWLALGFMGILRPAAPEQHLIAQAA